VEYRALATARTAARSRAVQLALLASLWRVLGKTFSRWGGFAAGEGYFGTLFSPVGVGEESLFRGVIQTELEERFGTWGGLVAASTIFGAIHFLNYGNDPKQGLIAVPVIATLGSSLGLAYIETGHRLETSVAMHFWYDFLLSSVAFAADPQHQPFVVQYGSTLWDSRGPLPHAFREFDAPAGGDCDSVRHSDCASGYSRCANLTSRVATTLAKLARTHDQGMRHGPCLVRRANVATSI
jgi:hypothetical protein